MYQLSYVENDALRNDEYTEAEYNNALNQWYWAREQPDITDVNFNVMTVDVRYSRPAGKVFTFFCEVDLSEYDYVDLNPNIPNNDPNKVYVYIVHAGYKSGVELKRKRLEERFGGYKTLHGVAKKFHKEGK